MSTAIDAVTVEHYNDRVVVYVGGEVASTFEGTPGQCAQLAARVRADYRI